MPVIQITLIASAVLVGVLVVLLVLRTTRRRRRVPPARPQTGALESRPLPAVVVNPVRYEQLPTVHAEISRVCAELGWLEPLWLETTIADPGIGQARTALAAGADVVLACGGDGTIRNVAHVLAGTGTPMGLVPAGTSNLLARNLAMQLDNVAYATRIALGGYDRRLDVGRVSVDDAEEENTFVVMAGMGFDAAIMAGAPPEWKARVGPLAYFVSGLRALKGDQLRVELSMDGQPALRRRVRTVVVGNCGRLLAGLVLMPAARVDDGLLDVVTIAPKGIIGWLAVTARVLTRRRSGHPIVEHWQGGSVTIIAEGSQQAQLDGDAIGAARTLRMRIDQGALIVRVDTAPGL